MSFETDTESCCEPKRERGLIALNVVKKENLFNK